MGCNAPHQVTQDVWQLFSPATLWIAIVALLRGSNKIIASSGLSPRLRKRHVAIRDLERQIYAGATALIRKDGGWRWLSGDDTTSKVRAVDGTELDANAFSPNDVLLLANATGAPNVRFDLAVGMSSSRRKGGGVSTEIIINLRGQDHVGSALSKRYAIVHLAGQMPLTGRGVALVLERLAGLATEAPRPGLYFPTQLIEHSTYLARLFDSGGKALELESLPQ